MEELIREAEGYREMYRDQGFVEVTADEYQREDTREARGITLKKGSSTIRLYFLKK